MKTKIINLKNLLFMAVLSLILIFPFALNLSTNPAANVATAAESEYPVLASQSGRKITQSLHGITISAEDKNDGAISHLVISITGTGLTGNNQFKALNIQRASSAGFIERDELNTICYINNAAEPAVNLTLYFTREAEYTVTIFNNRETDNTRTIKFYFNPQIIYTSAKITGTQTEALTKFGTDYFTTSVLNTDFSYNKDLYTISSGDAGATGNVSVPSGTNLFTKKSFTFTSKKTGTPFVFDFFVNTKEINVSFKYSDGSDANSLTKPFGELINNYYMFNKSTTISIALKANGSDNYAETGYLPESLLAMYKFSRVNGGSGTSPVTLDSLDKTCNSGVTFIRHIFNPNITTYSAGTFKDTARVKVMEIADTAAFDLRFDRESDPVVRVSLLTHFMNYYNQDAIRPANTLTSPIYFTTFTDASTLIHISSPSTVNYYIKESSNASAILNVNSTAANFYQENAASYTYVFYIEGDNPLAYEIKFVFYSFHTSNNIEKPINQGTYDEAFFQLLQDAPPLSVVINYNNQAYQLSGETIAEIFNQKDHRISFVNPGVYNILIKNPLFTSSVSGNTGGRTYLIRDFTIAGGLYLTGTTPASIYNGAYVNSSVTVKTLKAELISSYINLTLTVFKDNVFYGQKAITAAELATGITYTKNGSYKVIVSANNDGTAVSESFEFTITNQNFQVYSLASSDNFIIERIHPSSSAVYRVNTLKDGQRDLTETVGFNDAKNILLPGDKLLNLFLSQTGSYIITAKTRLTLSFKVSENGTNPEDYFASTFTTPSSFIINIVPGTVTVASNIIPGSRTTEDIVISTIITTSGDTNWKVDIKLDGKIINSYSAEEFGSLGVKDKTLTKDGKYTIVVTDQYGNIFETHFEKYYQMNTAAMILVIVGGVLLAVGIFLLVRIKGRVRVK